MALYPCQLKSSLKCATPVLNYLHRQGVIHRDISPDNIMLRSKDKQVVLIDMGGVKQVVVLQKAVLRR